MYLFSPTKCLKNTETELGYYSHMAMGQTSLRASNGHLCGRYRPTKTLSSTTMSVLLFSPPHSTRDDCGRRGVSGFSHPLARYCSVNHTLLRPHPHTMFLRFLHVPFIKALYN